MTRYLRAVARAVRDALALTGFVGGGYVRWQGWTGDEE